MNSIMASKSRSTQSQGFVPIKEIRDSIVVLKNGGVLMVGAMNLALKSAEEQEATLFQFQNFLNTLDFSIEIVVQSRRMDMRPYLQTLNARMLQQKEELLRIQTKMYIEYIRYFSEEVDIMKKYFFIVIPYSVSDSQTVSSSTTFIDRLFGSFKKKKKQQDTTPAEQVFEEKRLQLEQRLDVVRSGLQAVGLRAETLTTEALVDVYYSLYNPGDTQKAITNMLAPQ